MVDFKFLSQILNSLINKVYSLIAYQGLRASIPSYDILKYKSHSYSFTIVLNCSFFYPSCQILYHSDDVSRSCVLPW
jgi:hypothetical protein